MTMIQLTHRDLIGQDNPIPMLSRINEWHQLEGRFDLFPIAGRTEYRIEAWFPSDDLAKEFLLRLFEDEEHAENIWREQP